MSLSDGFTLFLLAMLWVSSIIGCCSRMCINDDIKGLRKRVNDHELRIIRFEWKNQNRGEVANETRD